MADAPKIHGVPTIKLNDGQLHPVLGYGTYKVGFIPASASSAGGVATGEGAQAKDIVRDALLLGYRFLDCAQFYGNEAAVGEAIAESGVAREELYLASKVWNDVTFQGRDAIRAQVGATLKDLGTDYLDLYLVHWPVPGKHVLAYKVLEELQAEGVLRSIGVSNYTVEDFEELKTWARVVPAVNQIEVNPFLYRRKTIEYFQSQGVAVQAYRALGQGKAIVDPTVIAVAEKHKRSPAQVLGRWAVQNGLIYIPKSVKVSRMEENAQVFDFELDGEDMAKLGALTAEEALPKFKALYNKCVIRDTPASADGIKPDITLD